jgi:hypothetical protein
MPAGHPLLASVGFTPAGHPLLASVGFTPAGPRLFSYRRFAQKPFSLSSAQRAEEREKERAKRSLSSCKFRLRRDEPDGRLIQQHCVESRRGFLDYRSESDRS